MIFYVVTKFICWFKHFGLEKERQISHTHTHPFTHSLSHARKQTNNNNSHKCTNSMFAFKLNDITDVAIIVFWVGVGGWRPMADRTDQPTTTWSFSAIVQEKREVLSRKENHSDNCRVDMVREHIIMNEMKWNECMSSMIIIYEWKCITHKFVQYMPCYDGYTANERRWL